MDLKSIRESLDSFDPEKTTYGEQLHLQLELLYIIANRNVCADCSTLYSQFVQDPIMADRTECSCCANRVK